MQKLYAFLLALSLLFTAPLVQATSTNTATNDSSIAQPSRVSLPGNYKGYSEAVYSQIVQKSVYVEVPAQYSSDQVEFPSDPNYQDDPSYDAVNNTIKLALTYVLPSQDGQTAVPGQYPTVMSISRGGRELTNGLHGEYLVKHGYAYVVVEMRGCGASFGVNNSFSSLENRLDVKYVIENWLIKQPWSDGSVGTEGGSNKGLIQWVTAATQPNGLKAIAPEVCNPDFYYQDYRNGVSACPGSGVYLSGGKSDQKIKTYEEWINTSGTTFVDDDPNGEMAYQAYCYQAEKNMPFTAYLLTPNLNRDEPNEYLYGEKVNLNIPAMEYSAELKSSGIQIHQMGGWDDSNAAHMLAAANTWGGHIIMGPWGHSSRGAKVAGMPGSDAVNMDEENLRYFDAVLKGIDNGYEDSPKFYYYVKNAASGTEWRYSDVFPLDNTDNHFFYLTPESGGGALDEALLLSGPQSNNGKLSLIQPTNETSDSYRVDLSIDIAGSSNSSYEDYGPLQNQVDAKGLTFTSEPLSDPVEIVGVTSADLWISCDNANDVDFIVYLEEVRANGTSYRIASGQIRASHRSLGANDMWDSMEGLSGRFHPSLTDDVEAALAQGLSTPVLLKFNLDATGYHVAEGSSLRFTITCADTNTFQHEPYYAVDQDENYIIGDDGQVEFKETSGLPLIKLYHGGDKASFITIPMVEDVNNTFNGTVTFADGSYTGPGTMYLFDHNWYLYANGDWTKLSVAANENTYTVQDGTAVFSTAGFSFLPNSTEGIKNGAAQNYQGEVTDEQTPAGQTLVWVWIIVIIIGAAILGGLLVFLGRHTKKGKPA